MTRPTYQECLDAGMTTKQCAVARGVTLFAVYSWERKSGQKFPRHVHSAEYRQVCRERLVRTKATRKWRDGVAGRSMAHISVLRRWGRLDEYKEIRKKGLSVTESLEVIGVDIAAMLAAERRAEAGVRSAHEIAVEFRALRKFENMEALW